MLLRPFRIEDFDAYARMNADPEVRRFFGDGNPISVHDSWQSMCMHIGHWQLRGFGLWAVELKATGEFIGRAGIWYPQGWPDLEAAWTIASPHWGHGYATEVGREGLRHAFDELGAQHVVSLIHPGNSRSVRVAEKLGGGLEGRRDLFGADTLIYGYASAPE